MELGNCIYIKQITSLFMGGFEIRSGWPLTLLIYLGVELPFN
jgi:hypothetical protein